MLQVKPIAPTFNPIKPLVAREGVFTNPKLPDTIDQLPAPMSGVLPVSTVVGEVMQMLCVGPVVAVVGAAST